MKKTISRNLLLKLCLSLLAFLSCSGKSVEAADFKQNVVYQIVTDRFFSGRKDNDDPVQSKGLFDAEKKNWHAYWGGDLKGIEVKLDYIKSLGAGAIWVSPVIDNQNKSVVDEKGAMTAPYHGYHARDFKRIDEHFGDPDNSFKDFDALTDAAHNLGMKIIVDMPFNHTSQYNHGEFGDLYDDGQFKGDPKNDRYKYFHHLPLVKDYNDRYQLQYGTIFYLADLNQGNSFVDQYLKASAEKLLRHGADATRIDAAKHTNWAWQYTLAEHLFKIANHLIVAEWWMSDGVEDPLFNDAAKYCRESGITLYDFPFATSIRKLFNKEGDFQNLAYTIKKENETFDDPCSLFTFIDNHDMPRFLSLHKDIKDLHLALSLLLTSRGIPIIYYGTEQYLHDDTKNGEDPYTRVWMSSFDQTSPGYTLIKSLCALRTSNPALHYGSHKSLHVERDAYVFERKFGKDICIVATNKNKTKTINIPLRSLKGSLDKLEDGEYRDKLRSTLSGVDLKIDQETSKEIALPPQSVSIWKLSSFEEAADNPPSIATVSPSVACGGTDIVVSGLGFGEQRGHLTIGAETIDVHQWSKDSIKFSAPHLLTGRQPLKVIRKDEFASEAVTITIREAKLVPITIRVEKPPLASKSEQLFITGSASALGNWSKNIEQSAGPMLLSDDRDYILCVAAPADTDMEFKLQIVDKKGLPVRTESKSHTYRVPETGTWEHKVNWQD